MDPNAFMMAGGMQMQRPQPGNENEQILGKILEELRKNPVPPGGWQATLELRKRAQWILALINALRQLNNSPDVMNAINVAMRFEGQILLSSPSEDQWIAGIKQKLGEVTMARQRRLQQQQQAQQAQAQQQQQQNAHMAVPMQPTRSHQGDMAGQAPMPPQMMGQMNMQQQQQQQQQQQPNMNPAMRPNQNLTPEEQKQIADMARSLLNGVKPEQLAILRERIFQTMTPQIREQMQRANQDPIPRHFHQMALKRFQQHRMQQQSQMGNQGIDFSAFAGQQADALKMQESGQLVVPASTNNNNNQNGNNMQMDAAAPNMANMGQTNMQPNMANNQQIQSMMAQRQQQTQAQIRNNQLQQQQAHAQAQARNAAQQAAQQQMLRGQPGGLNATQPPQQSPAMSMLNRPMVPPGAPSQTPPQARPQPTPQPNPQMNPQMMAQFGQQPNANNQNMFQQQKPLLTIPPDLNVPPALKARMETMPVEQQKLLLERIRQNQQAHQIQQAQQAQQGLMAGAAPGAPMNQQNLPNGMPNMGQMNPQQVAMGMQQGLNQQQLQQRLNMQRQREWDQRPFPPRILNDLCQVPPHVTTWGQLKEFVNGNQQNLAPDIADKVRRLQGIIISKQMAAAASARQGAGQAQMNGQPATGPAPNQPVMAGNQAPQAPMVVPQMNPQGMPNMNMPQNPPNLANFPIPQVTPQDIQMFRAKFPTAQQMTDDQVRQAVAKVKMAQMQRDPAAAQRAAAAMRNMQQQQAMNRPQQNLMAPQVPQMTPQAPPMQARPSQQNHFNGMPQNGNMEQKGQKRPGPSDDVVEIPDPNQSPQRPPTANGQQNRQPPKPMQFNPEQLRNLHPDKLKAMPPEQKAQIQAAMAQMQAQMQQRNQTEALKRAQSQTHQAQQAQAGQQVQQQMQGPQGQQGQQQNLAPQQQPQPNAAARQMMAQQHKAKLIAIMQETETTYRKGPPLAVDQHSMSVAIQKLQQTAGLLPKLEKMLIPAMAFANERIMRHICHERQKFLGEMTKEGMVNGYISLRPEQIDEMNAVMRKFMLTVINNVQNQTKASTDQGQQQQQPQQQPQPVPPKQPQPAPSAPMARGPSKSGASKPPPAPTTSQPPFSIGGANHAPSPHGVPLYEQSASNLTPDKLHLPPSKKRKTGAPNSSSSTPANQGTTPGSMPSPVNLKMHSPELNRRQQQQHRVEQQPKEPEKKFKCPDEYCDFSVQGFEREDELRTHVDETHKKIDDPLNFFLENAAAAFEVDMNGNFKNANADTSGQAQFKPPPAAIGKSPMLGPSTIKKEALKVEGQTPGKLNKPVTPSPFVKPGTPPTVNRTPQGVKNQQQVQPSAPTPPKTMMETIAEKNGISLPKTDINEQTSRKDSSTSPILGNNGSKDPSDTFMMSIRETLDGLDDGMAFGDMDWTIGPSPALTPSSLNSSSSTATSASSTNVDEHDRMKILFESDPFGVGSGVRFDLGDDLGMNGVGIQSTFDPREGKGEVNATPPPNMDWDTLFGPNAGMDRNSSNWDQDASGNSLFEGVVFFDS